MDRLHGGRRDSIGGRRKLLQHGRTHTHNRVRDDGCRKDDADDVGGDADAKR